MKINAILFGATGMVGEGVLLECLRNPDVESLLAVVRRPTNMSDPKLKELHHTDFYDYSSLESQLKGYNACFFCLGVTSVGKNEEEYTRLTYDLTMQAAKTLSRLNPDMTFCYVSGTGTDSTEKGSMWARVKGRTENHLLKLPFKAAYMFRPGFIKSAKGQKRAYRVAPVIDFLYPVLSTLFGKYGCTMDELSLAMVRSASKGFTKRVLENEDIRKLASS